jgi:hypothetical protein
MMSSFPRCEGAAASVTHAGPSGARVTLTRGQPRSARHLSPSSRKELGFWEVGFAPVTTKWQRDYAIADEGFEYMLKGFRHSRRIT